MVMLMKFMRLDIKRFSLVALAMAGLVAARTANAADVTPSVKDPEAVTVFESGMGGYERFRIPAVIRTGDGGILAFAEGRVNGLSDAGNIDLVCRKSMDGGRTWGPLQVIWDDRSNTCGNPAPVLLDNGKIVLLMTWNLGADKEHFIERNQAKDTRRPYVTYSDDDGKTWAEPEEITSSVKKDGWGWYATGPCHAIVKARAPHKGRIIVPSNHSEIGPDGNPCSRSQLIYSDDGGQTWALGAITEVSGNESTVAELKDGSIFMNMRHSESGDSVRLYAITKDGGESFSEQGRTVLVEPTCQGSIVSRKGKLFFSNPFSSSKRENLCIRSSSDGGRTWKTAAVVTEGAAAYSDIVVLKGKRLGVLYENGEGSDPYRRISFKVLKVK